MRHPLLVSAVVLLATAVAARAADPRHPDWPCRQIKVPVLSVASVWTGPPIDDVRDTWHGDPKLADLVARLAVRRTAIADADKLIADFLAGDRDARRAKARVLFAGLFDTLDRERTTVMEGIERFARKEKGLAERIREEAAELRALQDATDRDQAKIDELTNRITWDTRIYQDQRKTVGYVCEVPQLIEQRLFALGRTIQQASD